VTRPPIAQRKKRPSRALPELDKEDPFQKRVEQYLAHTGWLVFHDRATNHAHLNPSGFPDICAVHKGTGAVVFLELKSSVGTLSESQQEWRSALLTHDGPTTHHYAVARPCDETRLYAALDALRA